eukprot:gene17177-7883_t
MLDDALLIALRLRYQILFLVRAREKGRVPPRYLFRLLKEIHTNVMSLVALGVLLGPGLPPGPSGRQEAPHESVTLFLRHL